MYHVGTFLFSPSFLANKVWRVHRNRLVHQKVAQHFNCCLVCNALCVESVEVCDISNISQMGWTSRGASFTFMSALQTRIWNSDLGEVYKLNNEVYGNRHVAVLNIATILGKKRLAVMHSEDRRAAVPVNRVDSITTESFSILVQILLKHCFHWQNKRQSLLQQFVNALYSNDKVKITKWSVS